MKRLKLPLIILMMYLIFFRDSRLVVLANSPPPLNSYCTEENYPDPFISNQEYIYNSIANSCRLKTTYFYVNKKSTPFSCYPPLFRATYVYYNDGIRLEAFGCFSPGSSIDLSSALPTQTICTIDYYYYSEHIDVSLSACIDDIDDDGGDDGGDDDDNNTCPNVKIKIRGLPFQEGTATLRCNQ